jgi:predicted membrane-bound spermidine synthase
MYAINTLGAVFGTVAAGFVLLPLIGLRLSVFSAALLNFSAAGLAFRISSPDGGSKLPDAAPKRIVGSIDREVSGATPRWLLVAFALVGFLGIAYEVAWTRMLATFIGSSTYSFTLMLATFLLGIVLGSAIFERYLSQLRLITLRAFAWTQSGIAVFALCFLVLFRELPAIIPAILRSTNNSFAGMLLAQFVTCALAMLPEMFCRANDCACKPPTAVVSASNKPMTNLHLRSRRAPARARMARNRSPASSASQMNWWTQ